MGDFIPYIQTNLVDPPSLKLRRGKPCFVSARRDYAAARTDFLPQKTGDKSQSYGLLYGEDRLTAESPPNGVADKKGRFLKPPLFRLNGKLCNRVESNPVAGYNPLEQGRI